MRKKEQGVLTVEATIVLMVFVMFVLFLYNFAGVYRAQSAVSHAAIESADAVALESYLREVAFEADAQDVVYLASKLGGSATLDASTLESLRTANLPSLAKKKFVAAIASNETEADTKLRNLGVKDGLAGISFSESYMDLDGDNVIVFLDYVVEMQFPVFGFKEIRVTKAAKAKTFGEIMYAVSTGSNNKEWGSTSGDNRVEHGEYVEIYATPNYGYRFVCWDDNGNGKADSGENKDNPRRVKVTEAKKYTAIFEPTDVGVNLYLRRTPTHDHMDTAGGFDKIYRWDESQELGTVTGAGEYTHMQTATIQATAKANFTFVGWDDDNDGRADSTENPRKIVVDKTHNITALYQAKQFKLTLVCKEAGYGKIDYQYNTRSSHLSGHNTEVMVEYKHKVKLEAVAGDLYRFVRWENNDPNKSREIRITGDTTCTAIFERNTYVVSFYVNGNLLDQQEVFCGSSIDGSSAIIGSKMPADPKVSGQLFQGWIYNGSAFNGTTKVNGNIRVDAKLISPSITLSGGSAGSKTTTMTATTVPANMQVTWTTSNGGVLSVFSGKITAITEGTATVTASFVYEGKTYSASRNITVGIDRIKMEEFNYRTRTGIRHYFNTEVMDGNEFPYDKFPFQTHGGGWAQTGNLNVTTYNGVKYSKPYFFHRYMYVTGEELAAADIISPGGYSWGDPIYSNGYNMSNVNGYMFLNISPGVVYFTTNEITYKISQIS